MPLIGIIGNPVTHSLSPAIHNAMFWEMGLPYFYVAIELQSPSVDDLRSLLRFMGFRGFNVTIPYKEEAARLVDRLSDEASAAGAINTVVVEDGELHGYNTDIDGIVYAAESINVRRVENAMVLGAGGTARAALLSLMKMNVGRILIANRTLSRAERLSVEFGRLGMDVRAIPLEEARDHLKGIELVVNTTSVGLKKEDRPLLDSESLRSVRYLIDVVYSPSGTALLREGSAAGCRVSDGIKVLIGQAVRSFELWTGQKPDPIFMEKIARARLESVWR
ncbi:MAG: shikimate dehydrogenase [Aigarchaeota archaeon]|nr:shikimate dehydrogenase [Aigarchaeota archaeon]MDW8092262.1 shikimate dehydrogenase [Nitrososphaerota archaeon]